ncbi:carboxymuconolactone decarboxylase family protein [Microbacterium halophytorum]|uniref:carboxymuconolactone decarboxylase family protein n=1 Tax=Microbacterium halophytorum TaxID=2067568 RepID=UPI000CFE3290|nr:carboxymuconolactone decarboxylase family protein [Microbacterium halophytorum]
MTDKRVHLNKGAPELYKRLSDFADEAAEFAAARGIDPRLKELVLLHCSQLNGCAYCVRVHSERGEKAGVTFDEMAQLPVWRESGVFTEREKAAIELAEELTFIHDGGVRTEAYARVTAALSDEEYVAVSWLAVEINSFNRLVRATGLSPKPLGRG